MDGRIWWPGGNDTLPQSGLPVASVLWVAKGRVEPFHPGTAMGW